MPITIPSDTIYKWATGTGRRIEPTSTVKVQGAVSRQGFGFGVFNHVVGVMSDWVYAAAELLVSPIGRAAEAATVVPIGQCAFGGGWYAESGIVVTQGTGGNDETKFSNPTGGALSAYLFVPSVAAGGDFSAAGALRLFVPDRSDDSTAIFVNMIGSVASALTVPAESAFENLAVDATVVSIPLVSGTGVVRGPFGFLFSIALLAGADITISRLVFTSAAE